MGKEYTDPKVKETSMYLQSMGLSEHQCSKALKMSVETVTNCKLVGKLPSHSTQSRLSSEMKALALKRVAEETNSAKNLTLKYDGTTDKSGRHITEVEIATGKETFLVGLKPQAAGAASDYVQSIEDSLHSIDNAQNNPKGTLLSNVSNTMTDRHIINSAIDKTLAEKKGGKINPCRCFLHPPDTFEKRCDKVLKDDKEDERLKKLYSTLPYQHRGESMTQALMRCFEKLFHGNDINIGQDLTNYFRGLGFKTTPQQWVGNKFNLLFQSGKLRIFVCATYHSLPYKSITVQKPSSNCCPQHLNG